MADLVVEHLTVLLDTGVGAARVVDDVSFTVPAGRAVALVGESGSGKTLTALALLRLLPDVAQIGGGSVRLQADGTPSVDVLSLSERALAGVRGARIGMVFQEPMTALNPLLRVDDQAGEALRVHRGLSKKAARAAASSLLERLGVPAARASAYPHELSGGQRQRVMLAVALAASPEVLIADEPTTALDVTVQAQILALLQQEQKARGLALLLITHDLGVVAEVCDDVVVMYAGRVVENGSVVDVFAAPRHPYTRALLASIPARATPGEPLPQIPGQVPALSSWPTGCRFRDRCPSADDACTAEPPVVVIGAQTVRCFHPVVHP
ncbi:MAG: ABC transporter ATP-binding protein [Deltaproteobacteria bacterium]|nr:ABC transporter ATP-binding protein [Deltaproteobacteria bacterium]